MTVHEVASHCRGALDEFLALDPQDVRGLSRWFTGSYRRAVGAAGSRRPLPEALAHGGPPSIQQTTSSAQATLRAAMKAAAEPGARGLVAMLPPVLELIAVRDVFGGRGYAPLNPWCTRLETRVLSLLMAEYLTSPGDYMAGVAGGATSTSLG